MPLWQCDSPYWADHDHAKVNRQPNCLLFWRRPLHPMLPVCRDVDEVPWIQLHWLFSVLEQTVADPVIKTIHSCCSWSYQKLVDEA
jgi:hypothetical protein